jgi:flagellar motor switch protein FliG
LTTKKALSNTEKAALALLSLGHDLASQILKHLTETEVKRLSRAFMLVNELPREAQLEVARDFRNLIKGGGTLLVDGRNFAEAAISGAFGATEGQGMLDYITGTKKEPISQIMNDIPEKILAGFMQTEHPQTVAFLLTRMNPEQSARVLETLSEEDQVNIIVRVSSLNMVKSETIDEVREVLRTQLRSVSLGKDEEINGAKSAADILNFVDRINEGRLMTEMEELDPEMAEQIRGLMFTFEDIKKIDDRGIQTLLKEVPRDRLILCLKKASDEVRELLFRNISQRAAQMLQDDLSATGPVKLKDVEKAQRDVVDIVRRLESEGKIALSAGEEDATV